MICLNVSVISLSVSCLFVCKTLCRLNCNTEVNNPHIKHGVFQLLTLFIIQRSFYTYMCQWPNSVNHFLNLTDINAIHYTTFYFIGLLLTKISVLDINISLVSSLRCIFLNLFLSSSLFYNKFLLFSTYLINLHLSYDVWN
jgi:uncharacterized protein YacL